MMLKNTLLLPGDDPQLSIELFDKAISDLQVVLLLVLGRQYQQIVEWADQLCNKTQAGDLNVRRVVWIHNPVDPAMNQRLQPYLNGGSPVVIVLNFYDKVACQLPVAGETWEDIDPIQLEASFLKGHGV